MGRETEVQFYVESYQIPGRVLPNTLKIVLDSCLLNTQHYKVSFNGKVEQSKERSSALPYTSL